MIYEFTCTTCDHAFDAPSSIANRDAPKDCPECGAKAQRVEIPSSCVVDTKGGYHMGAVLKSGETVKGSFGIARNDKWRKP